MQKIENLIIGAGISGSYLAYQLKKNDIDCLILEKSSGIGGRIATRRIEDYPFDHGLSYFPKNSEFNELLKEVDLKKITLETAYGQFLLGGVNQIAKVLCSQVKVLKNTKIEKIYKSNNGWISESDDGEKFEAKNVILTAPMPQALELLKKNNLETNHKSLELNKITYNKALIALVISKTQVKMPIHLHNNLKSVHKTLDKNSHPFGYIFEFTSDFANEHFEKADDEIIQELKRIILQTMEEGFQIKNFQLKKWRYATPQETINESFIEIMPHLYLIGDSFLNPSIMGALGSAKALADYLMKKT